MQCDAASKVPRHPLFLRSGLQPESKGDPAMVHSSKTPGSVFAKIAFVTMGVAVSCAPTLAQGWQHLGAVQRIDRSQDGVELLADGGARVRVTAFRHGIVRVRVAPQG